MTRSTSAPSCSWSADLVTLMATIFLAPMFAALYMFCAAGIGLFFINLVPLLRPGQWSFRKFIAPIQSFLDSYIDMITDIPCSWRPSPS